MGQNAITRTGTTVVWPWDRTAPALARRRTVVRRVPGALRTVEHIALLQAGVAVGFGIILVELASDSGVPDFSRVAGPAGAWLIVAGVLTAVLGAEVAARRRRARTGLVTVEVLSAVGLAGTLSWPALLVLLPAAVILLLLTPQARSAFPAGLRPGSDR